MFNRISQKKLILKDELFLWFVLKMCLPAYIKSKPVVENNISILVAIKD